jgi:hypothetical protein
MRRRRFPLMKKIVCGVAALLFFLTSWAAFPVSLHADVDWSIVKEIKIKDDPLDVTSSADGKTLFILTPGKIIVYSIAQKKEMAEIPVDKAFDNITVSPRDNALIVSSRAKKTLKIIQLEFIYDIDISGLPVLGSREAPVTIAVYSDYQ